MTSPESLNLLNLAVKLLTWAATPLGLLCLGVATGSMVKRIRPSSAIGPIIMGLAVLQIVAFAMPPLAYQLQASLEHRAANLHKTNVGQPYDGILLLGGLTRSTRSPLSPDWQPDITEAADRAHHAARLWHDGMAPRIIVAGGVWPANPPKPTEAFWIQQLLLQLGVPQDAIVLEDRSTTTRENVRNVAQIMQTNGWAGRLALVTSASHMPRAYANAERAGLKVDAYPTDWQGHAAMDRPITWLPNADALQLSSRTLKEWIALLARY
ncbi:MAG: YdcF family protein [Burkholderiaceae bacterium]|nr:YdcF family protein [Burkholderiaceae bacterium]MCD8537122.1 YdcF family protein [Burkholderiaceae bacterium]